MPIDHGYCLYMKELFNFFPNPARNILYMSQPKNELIKTIKVFNSIGQKQMIEYFSTKNGEYVEINTSMLSAGVYFLEMKTEKQKIVPARSPDSGRIPTVRSS